MIFELWAAQFVIIEFDKFLVLFKVRLVRRIVLDCLVIGIEVGVILFDFEGITRILALITRVIGGFMYFRDVAEDSLE